MPDGGERVGPRETLRPEEMPPVVTRRDIQAFADRIVEAFRPERIVLFGSHAEGTAGPHSDVDLLVIMPWDGNPLRASLTIIERLQPAIPVDIIVRTPEDVQRRLAWNDFFLRDILDRGEVLYEAAHARMD